MPTRALLIPALALILALLPACGTDPEPSDENATSPPELEFPPIEVPREVCNPDAVDCSHEACLAHPSCSEQREDLGSGACDPPAKERERRREITACVSDEDCVSSQCGEPDHVGDVVITHPADLAALQGIEHLDGALIIENTSGLKSLDGLESLTCVGGLSIRYNEDLETLKGLDSLSIIKGNLSIIGAKTVTTTDDEDEETITRHTGHAALETLDALGELRFVVGDVEIAANPALEDLTGLQNLVAIGGSFTLGSTNTLAYTLQPVRDDIFIPGNSGLVSLHGLEALSDVSGDFSISGNNALADLDGLCSLRSVGESLSLGFHVRPIPSRIVGEEVEDRLFFDDNANLTDASLPALERTKHLIVRRAAKLANLSAPKLQDVEDLTLSGNPALGNAFDFPALSTVTGKLSVVDNQGTTSLLGFETLRQVQTLVIDTMPGLKSLDGLGALEKAENVEIINLVLDDFSGLDRIREVNGILYIGAVTTRSLAGLESLELAGGITLRENPGLETLEGLSSLTTLSETGLRVEDNPDLKSLDGLTSLTRTTTLFVESNPRLESIGDFPRLTQATALLHLTDMPVLSSLAGLSSLKTVGEFGIARVPNLTTLGGLESLEEVEVLSLNSTGLTSLRGLAMLEHVEGALTLERNASLETMSGPASLTRAGAISLEQNGLRTLEGLESLIEVREDVRILKNDALVSLRGLDNLGRVGGDLILTENPALADLSALDRLLGIMGSFEVTLNPALRDLAGLDALQRIDGSFVVGNNAGLIALGDFPLLRHIGGNLRIYRNDMLGGVGGLRDLQTLDGHLFIRFNPVLQTLDGFSWLTHIGSENLTESDTSIIADNASLLFVGGFKNLRGVRGKLAITNNDAMLSLAGLNGLRRVSGSLEISNNAVLEDLDALTSLEDPGSELRIENNPLLPSCDIDQLSNRLIAQGWMGILVATSNGPDCM